MALHVQWLESGCISWTSYGCWHIMLLHQCGSISVTAAIVWDQRHKWGARAAVWMQRYYCWPTVPLHTTASESVPLKLRECGSRKVTVVWILQCECNDIGYRNSAARLGKMRAIWVICTKMGKGALELGGKNSIFEYSTWMSGWQGTRFSWLKAANR